MNIPCKTLLRSSCSSSSTTSSLLHHFSIPKNRSYASVTTPPGVRPPPPSSTKTSSSTSSGSSSASSSGGGGGGKVVGLLIGGGGAGLAGYYYYDPNADIFKQARSVLGLSEPGASKKADKKAAAAEQQQQQQRTAEKRIIGASELKKSVAQRGGGADEGAVEGSRKLATGPPVPSAPIPAKVNQAATAVGGVASVAASAMGATKGTTTAATTTTAASKSADSVVSSVGGDAASVAAASSSTPDSVPKHVLITALRAQMEALSESSDAKIKVIQEEYDRRLNNAAQVIEAERVVDLRAKYEKASAALQAIEKGIEGRSDMNTRAKRLRSLWAQVNALHARVNHPEYHGATITRIDKGALMRSVQVPDTFVTQMVNSLPAQPVHSVESLKKRFYQSVEPVVKSVGLIQDREGFSLWKYALGKVFTGAMARVQAQGSGTPTGSSSASSPVQNTATAVDTARTALERGDLLSAAIAVNQLKGLPREVASDWLSDARALLETNQTLFVLMTYAASNNVF